MRILKPSLAGLLIYVMLFFMGCKSSNEQKAPVALTWEMGAANIEPGYYENTFTLKNISDKPLDKDWAIYYSQLPRKIKQDAVVPVKVEAINSNFFKISPTETFETLAPGDSIRITFKCSYKLDRNSHAPEGTYFVRVVDGQEINPMSVELINIPLPNPELIANYPNAGEIYAANLLLADTTTLTQTEILPSVKKAIPAAGSITINGKVSMTFPAEYSGEAKLLKEKLATNYGIEVTDNAPVSIVLEPMTDKAKAVNDEYYTLYIGDNQVKISATTPHGIFNGTQTLLAMLKAQPSPYKLQAVAIEDFPDLLYRGQMIDICRNFTTVDNLKKLIDIFASYKLNVLHFHFSEDEAWRLEIPGLEELTAVGSRRGHTTDESDRLYPGYEGNFDPTASTSGNGFYTRDEFISLLKYAAERHVAIIPEIESPGHARAAIVSMKARYKKYIDTDPAKATEYLLHDDADTSRYETAQYYDDNVMNPALPSTYRFMQKVITELAAMYKDAGVPVTAIHVGGDEVPEGVWIGSPACQKFMAENGMTKAHDLSEYFITQLASFMKSQNLKLMGWQEVALGHTKEGHDLLRGQTAGINCWNTIPDWGGDQVIYQTANNGYPVILCNVGNFYMDMAYNGDPDEPGLDWGGCVDEATSFSMLPFNIYRSRRTSVSGKPFDLDNAAKGKTTLTADGRKNILGVQGQFFAETLRGFQWLEYHLFPKMMGLVERGWNANPAWGTLTGDAEKQAFHKALALYYEKIGNREMPYWAKMGINFHLPQPGLLLKDGNLYANSAYPAEIRYTTDGTVPTAQSTLWTAPVKCDAAVVKARIFYEGKQSLPITLLKK